MSSGSPFATMAGFTELLQHRERRGPGFPGSASGGNQRNCALMKLYRGYQSGLLPTGLLRCFDVMKFFRKNNFQESGLAGEVRVQSFFSHPELFCQVIHGHGAKSVSEDMLSSAREYSSSAGAIVRFPPLPCGLRVGQQHSRVVASIE
jgi:hypothetical protein